jgi:hypothetical protein
VIKRRNEDGNGRPFVEARALLFVMLAALAASVLTAVLVSPPARAATYTVTNTNDSGAGSLRQAIIEANASGGVTDTINFDLNQLEVITLATLSQLPAITDPAGLTIDGSSVNSTISGAEQHRVFRTSSSARLTLDSLTVAEGNAEDGDGGATYNEGALEVSNSGPVQASMQRTY